MGSKANRAAVAEARAARETFRRGTDDSGRRLTLPERIRAWVRWQFNPAHVDRVTADLIDAATGNREGNAFEKKALRLIFPEWDTTAECVVCGNTQNLETDRDEGMYSCERCERVWGPPAAPPPRPPL